GQDGAGALRGIVELLDEVKAIETAALPARQEWQRAGRKPNERLSAVMNQLAEVIDRLRTLVGEAERAARAQHARLAPDLECLARGRHMQRAYRGVRSGD